MRSRWFQTILPMAMTLTLLGSAPTAHADSISDAGRRSSLDALDFFLDLVSEPASLQPERPSRTPVITHAPLGWEPYAGPFGMAEAAHLLGRSLAGPTFEEIEAARDRGLEATLDLLFAVQPLPDPPGPWVNEPLPSLAGLTAEEKKAIQALTNARRLDLRLWWVETIVGSPLSLVETMTHFWHDHFATGMKKVGAPQTMYRQLTLLRQHSLGNFKTLAHQIAVDPAMLIWLDGRKNRVGKPNENFARELLELFTMGEGSGYTQFDVLEAARACTGWKTDGLASQFYPYRHDDGVKTILGHTGNWGMDDLIDLIFAESATADYLCGKLCQWFLDDTLAPEDVAALAQVMRDNSYEVGPVLRTILGSQQFFNAQFRGSIICDGVDLYAGQLRRFHVEGFHPRETDTKSVRQMRWVKFSMEDFGHVLLEPPNVAGWPGHRNWINTSTLPDRKLYGLYLLNGKYKNSKMDMQVDVLAETQRFSDPNDPFAIVDDLSLLCFGQPPTELVRETMLEALLQGAEPYDWNIGRPDAADRLYDLFLLTMQLPDYQLK